MTETLEGTVVFARFERFDKFDWTDPSNGQIKQLRSVKVLHPHGDGTITRESISIPAGMNMPNLETGKVYGFPCVITVSRKKGTLSLTLRSDMKPFPAPPLE